MTTPDNNKCYFKVDSTIDNNLLAANIITFDTQAKSIQPNMTFDIQGNASFSSKATTQGLTSGSSYNLNAESSSSTLSINLHGNRLSNVARPVYECSPVPAYYVNSPEYYFCSLQAYGRLTMPTEQGALRMLNAPLTIYQSRNINQIFRFVGFKAGQQRVTAGGSSAIQLLAIGTYMFFFSIGKRWGWNNGWGGYIYLKRGDGKVFSGNTVYSGGGYADQGGLGTAMRITSVAPDPNASNLGEHRNNVFYFDLEHDQAVLNSFSFGLIYYPDIAG
ncbi:hypothetical protein [Candidatus Chlamydia sanziniae]|uniref:Uncharacterized protein n=1 Tax=Candidatus Chlamydia sanziniae TaxID=1806891 RepID=A0A1A9HYK9_9CHLA|nr:hypothetical protein [Candidatus Chlamydia sanziniae]ANH79006.1 hypothetical protein Cs308_0836 [Candidatus Chlamydia sanziniae]